MRILSGPFLRKPRFLRCVFTGDCVLTPLRGRLAASRRGSQAPDHTCLKYPTGSPESVLAAVFIPRCGQSVAAAVGESHRKKIIRIRYFYRLAPMSHLSAFATASVKSERALASSQALI